MQEPDRWKNRRREANRQDGICKRRLGLSPVVLKRSQRQGPVTGVFHLIHPILGEGDTGGRIVAGSQGRS